LKAERSFLIHPVPATRSWDGAKHALMATQKTCGAPARSSRAQTGEKRKIPTRSPTGSSPQFRLSPANDSAIYPGQIFNAIALPAAANPTLLRMLTGLSPATGRRVYWHGHPGARRIAKRSPIVFQSFALFPWLTVIENGRSPPLEASGHASPSSAGKDRSLASSTRRPRFGL